MEGDSIARSSKTTLFQFGQVLDGAGWPPASALVSYYLVDGALLRGLFFFASASWAFNLGTFSLALSIRNLRVAAFLGASALLTSFSCPRSLATFSLPSPMRC